MERIDRYRSDAPGTKVVPHQRRRRHSDVVRYVWKIITAQGRDLTEGLDVAKARR